ncbi:MULTISPECIES: hypothetical protein [Pantoea]|uniref:hypothetical protein n=1 Tax=Pantoea TaxID=53335 RepID=UPI00059D5002|nr:MULTISPECIES: hypothetical protein [Pantoea]
MKLLLRFLSWIYDVTYLRHGSYFIIFLMLFTMTFLLTASLMGDALRAFCVTAFIFFIYSALCRNLMEEVLFYMIPGVWGSVLLYVVLMDHFASAFRAMFSSHG